METKKAVAVYSKEEFVTEGVGGRVVGNSSLQQ